MARLDAESRAGMPGAGAESSERNSRVADPRASSVTATQGHSCLETGSLMEAVVAVRLLDQRRRLQTTT